MYEVAEGVFEIRIGFVNAHLMVVDNGVAVVLVDTGLPGRSAKVQQAMNSLQRLTERILKPAQPVPVDDVLTADVPLPLAGFSVVHTPGHTAGHVSYLLERGGGVLFAGDAAAGSHGGKVRRTPRFLTSDMASAAASLSRLAQLDFDVAVFGHGGASTARAAERFRELNSR